MSRASKKIIASQDIQDDIFRKMTADEKLKLGSELWRLAKELVGQKINYGANRSSSTARKNR